MEEIAAYEPKTDGAINAAAEADKERHLARLTERLEELERSKRELMDDEPKEEVPAPKSAKEEEPVSAPKEERSKKDGKGLGKSPKKPKGKGRSI